MIKILEEILDKCRKHTKEGAVANYIPKLAKANPDEFGISIMLDDGNIYSVGDSEKRFTMQSVVKPIILLLALMDAGEFAVNVGVPAKSGVGGGIMAVVPGRMGIGLYSPSLDKKGNSVASIRALELLSEKLDLSIF